MIFIFNRIDSSIYLYFCKKKRMAEHNDLGKEGEDAACTYLEAHGYIIRHRNWRWRKLELDIIAEKENTLIVIEVKTRRNNQFGDPEDAVTDDKIRRIVRATDTYMKKFCIDFPVRFDIISVTGSTPPFQIDHIEDAFFPPLW